MPTDHSSTRLGKLTPRHDPRTLLLANYLDSAKLDPAPATASWVHKVSAWPMMQNDSIGDCTCAAAGHHVQCWTANATHEVIISDKDIIAAYSAITGYVPGDESTDRGAVEIEVLNYWRKNGIGDHRIGAYVALEPKNHEHIRDAVMVFGGCYMGLALPVSAQRQSVWSVPPGGPAGTGAPGSWGGHAVPVVAYDARGVTVVTWGALKKMTWGFLDAYCDEAYAIVSKEWIQDSGKAPSGLDMATLIQDLKQITG